MRTSRFSEEQIIAVLKAAEGRQPPADMCRKHGISEHTFYRWHAKYGGMDVSDARKLRALERARRLLGASPKTNVTNETARFIQERQANNESVAEHPTRALIDTL